MTVKKKKFNENEITIFDEALIYKRGEHWHFRMWLEDEKKYARRSLKTKKETEAKELAKSLYFKIYSKIQQGDKFFSMSAKEGVDAYLKERYNDVIIGLIVKKRHKSLSQHLKHFLNFVGENKKLKELRTDDLVNYYKYRLEITNNNVKTSTVASEQITINAMVKWLYKKKEIDIVQFEFKKLPKMDTGNETVRRSTLTIEEYERLARVMRSYIARTTKPNKNLTEKELKFRKLVQHYILIASNSGLRVGEQLQLRWKDVRIEEHSRKNGDVAKLARINVRAETSKVRKSRTLLCRNGQYFERLRKILGDREDEDLIFSEDGGKRMWAGIIGKEFKKLLAMADIKDYEGRGIVLYSLRHFMITQRIMAGLSLRQVADMCGTSVAMIEQTYWHLNDEMRKTAAMADFRLRKDGTVEII
jgi:integrase